jgi:hypothetical protein
MLLFYHWIGSGRFTPGEIASGDHWIVIRVGPTASLEVVRR